MNDTDPRMVVTIRYTNYKGETADRRVIPLRLHFTATEWHPEPQWVMEAFDIDRGADRSFAVRDILGWNAAVPSAVLECGGTRSVGRPR